jgi:hypothetical protein
MKKYFLICLTGLCMILTSCSKDELNDSTPVTTQAVNASLTTGGWKITLFNRNGNDITDEFRSFRFTFSDNKTVMAINEILTAHGAWDTEVKEGRTSLKIAFPNPPFITMLNGEWPVVEKTNSKIILENVNAEGEATSVLVFEKG